MKFIPVLILLLLPTIILPQAVPPRKVDQDLLTRLLIALRRNESQVENFRATVKVTYDWPPQSAEPKRPEWRRAEYVWEGEKFYHELESKSRENGQRSAVSFDGTERRVLNRRNGSAVVGIERGDYPFIEGMERYTNLWIDDMRMSHFIERSDVLEINGDEKHIRILVNHFDSSEDWPVHVEIYFDPQRAMSPLKILTYTPEQCDEPVMVYEVKEFRQVLPHFYVPVKGKSELYQCDGQERSLKYSKEMKVLSIELNVKVQPEDFRVSLPKGTFVNHKIMGKHFTVGEQEALIEVLMN